MTIIMIEKISTSYRILFMVDTDCRIFNIKMVNTFHYCIFKVFDKQEIVQFV